MNRAAATAAGLLVLLSTGTLPAEGQSLVGERLCATGLPRGGEFGSAVAVAGDGTIAVGDYLHDVVYLFHRGDAGSCKPPVTIQSPDHGSWFGFALAIDGTRLLVGAPRFHGIGAAYLYDLTRALPEPVETLTVPQAQRGDEVGCSVALQRDVRALGARGTAARRGLVYFGSVDHLEAAPIPDRLAPKAELGQSIALSGHTLVMGGPVPYHGSHSPGTAWVFDLESRRLLPLAPRDGLEDEAAFGYAVAVNGDRILVGSPLADRNGVDSGAVYGFRLSAGTWEQDPVPQPLLSGQRGAQLGVAVALDEGPSATAVIGARYAGGTRGAAYLVEGSGGTHALQPRETVPAGAQLGFAVAIRNGTVVVGAFREAGTGAAYEFELVPAIHLNRIDDVQESSATVEVTVSADEPVPRDVTVQISTEDGTASAGHDYEALPRQGITLRAGETSAHLAIRLLPDRFCEDKETFAVALFDPAGGEAVQRVPVTIVDDDPGDLELTPAPLLTSEDGTPSRLKVRLTCPPFAAVQVSLEAIPVLAGFSPGDLTFTNEDWSRPQAVSVSGTDDGICGPAVAPYEIQAITTSADPRYAGLSRSSPAENADDEQACLSAAKTVCTDAGGTVTYTISLTNSVSGVPNTAAQLLDILPPEVSVVTASADLGTATTDTVANSVRWTGPVAAAGSAVTITIVAALDVPPGPEVRNHARVTYARDGRGTLQTVETNEVAFAAGDIISCFDPELDATAAGSPDG